MQCSPSVCQEFKDEFEWGERMSTEEQNKYKFVMDVDGNGWSGRFHRYVSLFLSFLGERKLIK